MSLTFIADWDGLHLAGGAVSCAGVASGSPSSGRSRVRVRQLHDNNEDDHSHQRHFRRHGLDAESLQHHGVRGIVHQPPGPVPGYPNTPGGRSKTDNVFHSEPSFAGRAACVSDREVRVLQLLLACSDTPGTGPGGLVNDAAHTVMLKAFGVEAVTPKVPLM